MAKKQLLKKLRSGYKLKHLKLEMDLPGPAWRTSSMMTKDMEELLTRFDKSLEQIDRIIGRMRKDHDKIGNRTSQIKGFSEEELINKIKKILRGADIEKEVAELEMVLAAIQDEEITIFKNLLMKARIMRRRYLQSKGSEIFLMNMI